MSIRALYNWVDDGLGTQKSEWGGAEDHEVFMWDLVRLECL